MPKTQPDVCPMELSTTKYQRFLVSLHTYILPMTLASHGLKITPQVECQYDLIHNHLVPNETA